MSLTKPSGATFNEFSTPFPGQSLMYESGTQPYEKPPAIPRANQSQEDALQEILDNFTNSAADPENLSNIQNLLRSGQSPQKLATQYLMSLNMYGNIQTDFALNASAPIAMQIGFIGEVSGIKMNLEEGNDSAVNEVELNTLLSNKSKDLDKEAFEAAVQEYDDKTSPSKLTFETSKNNKKNTGLMSRAVEDISNQDTNDEVLT
jgi:cation transport regulator ChaB